MDYLIALGALGAVLVATLAAFLVFAFCEKSHARMIGLGVASLVALYGLCYALVIGL